MSDRQSTLADDDRQAVGYRRGRTWSRTKPIVASPTELRSFLPVSEAPFKKTYMFVSPRAKKTSGSKFISGSDTWYVSGGKSASVNPNETTPKSTRIFPKESDFLPEFLREDRRKRVFDWLHAQWDKDMYFDSSATNAVSHPAYHVIIALGPSMIPLILDKVRSGENHWSKALSVLTGSQPSAKDKLNTKTLREFWLNWEEKNQDRVRIY